ncbi:MAG: hypothetical protein HDT14_02555 [Oscillibacter sp.]|nr:hypothetical protein [Oscillibacter sp.]
MKKNRPFVYLLIFYLVMLVSLLIVFIPSITKSINAVFENDVGMLLILFLFLIAAITVVLILLYTTIYRREQGEGSKRPHTSALSDERKYFEGEIISLNQKLVATEKRWNDAYYLLLSSQNRQKNDNGTTSVSNFLKGFGIDINELPVKNNLVFVLTPFHPDFDSVFTVIKRACADVKMTAVRSDDEYIKTDILKHIIKTIVEARVVIANLDGRNANVFYELGIAHALNKPTILLSKMGTKVPFDVQGQYIVLYDSDESLSEKLKDDLVKILTSNSID